MASEALRFGDLIILQLETSGSTMATLDSGVLILDDNLTSPDVEPTDTTIHNKKQPSEPPSLVTVLRLTNKRNDSDRKNMRSTIFTCGIFKVESPVGQELLGNVVVFGAIVRLSLQRNGNYLSTTSNGNINTIDPESTKSVQSKDYCFRIQPNYRVRSDGDVIAYHDLVCFEDSFHRFMTQNYKGEMRFDISHSKRASFRLSKYVSSDFSSPQNILGGSYIKLYHQEEKCFLGSVFDTIVDAFQPKPIASISSNLDEANNIWQIEVCDPLIDTNDLNRPSQNAFTDTSGDNAESQNSFVVDGLHLDGLVKNKTRFRLRNVVSQKYLFVHVADPKFGVDKLFADPEDEKIELIDDLDAELLDEEQPEQAQTKTTFQGDQLAIASEKAQTGDASVVASKKQSPTYADIIYKRRRCGSIFQFAVPSMSSEDNNHAFTALHRTQKIDTHTISSLLITSGSYVRLVHDKSNRLISIPKNGPSTIDNIVLSDDDFWNYSDIFEVSSIDNAVVEDLLHAKMFLNCLKVASEGTRPILKQFQRNDKDAVVESMQKSIDILSIICPSTDGDFGINDNKDKDRSSIEKLISHEHQSLTTVTDKRQRTNLKYYFADHSSVNTHSQNHVTNTREIKSRTDVSGILFRRQEILHALGLTALLMAIANNGVGFENHLKGRFGGELTPQEIKTSLQLAKIAIKVLEHIIRGNNRIARFTVEQSIFGKEQSIFSSLLSHFDKGELFNWNTALLEIVRALYLDIGKLSAATMIISEADIRVILRHIFDQFEKDELPSVIGYDLLALLCAGGDEQITRTFRSSLQQEIPMQDQIQEDVCRLLFGSLSGFVDGDGEGNNSKTSMSMAKSYPWDSMFFYRTYCKETFDYDLFSNDVRRDNNIFVIPSMFGQVCPDNLFAVNEDDPSKEMKTPQTPSRTNMVASGRFNPLKSPGNSSNMASSTPPVTPVNRRNSFMRRDSNSNLGGVRNSMALAALAVQRPTSLVACKTPSVEVRMSASGLNDLIGGQLSRRSSFSASNEPKNNSQFVAGSPYYAFISTSAMDALDLKDGRLKAIEIFRQRMDERPGNYGAISLDSVMGSIRSQDPTNRGNVPKTQRWLQHFMEAPFQTSIFMLSQKQGELYASMINLLGALCVNRNIVTQRIIRKLYPIDMILNVLSAKHPGQINASCTSREAALLPLETFYLIQASYFYLINNLYIDSAYLSPLSKYNSFNQLSSQKDGGDETIESHVSIMKLHTTSLSSNSWFDVYSNEVRTKIFSIITQEDEELFDFAGDREAFDQFVICMDSIKDPDLYDDELQFEVPSFAPVSRSLYEMKYRDFNEISSDILQAIKKFLVVHRFDRMKLYYAMKNKKSIFQRQVLLKIIFSRFMDFEEETVKARKYLELEDNASDPKSCHFKTLTTYHSSLLSLTRSLLFRRFFDSDYNINPFYDESLTTTVSDLEAKPTKITNCSRRSFYVVGRTSEDDGDIRQWSDINVAVGVTKYPLLTIAELLGKHIIEAVRFHEGVFNSLKYTLESEQHPDDPKYDSAMRRKFGFDNSIGLPIVTDTIRLLRLSVSNLLILVDIMKSNSIFLLNSDRRVMKCLIDLSRSVDVGVRSEEDQKSQLYLNNYISEFRHDAKKLLTIWEVDGLFLQPLRNVTTNLSVKGDDIVKPQNELAIKGQIQATGDQLIRSSDTEKPKYAWFKIDSFLTSRKSRLTGRNEGKIGRTNNSTTKLKGKQQTVSPISTHEFGKTIRYSYNEEDEEDEDNKIITDGDFDVVYSQPHHLSSMNLENRPLIELFTEIAYFYDTDLRTLVLRLIRGVSDVHQSFIKQIDAESKQLKHIDEGLVNYITFQRTRLQSAIVRYGHSSFTLNEAIKLKKTINSSSYRRFCSDVSAFINVLNNDMNHSYTDSQDAGTGYEMPGLSTLCYIFDLKSLGTIQDETGGHHNRFSYDTKTLQNSSDIEYNSVYQELLRYHGIHSLILQFLEEFYEDEDLSHLLGPQDVYTRDSMRGGFVFKRAKVGTAKVVNRSFKSYRRMISSSDNISIESSSTFKMLTIDTTLMSDHDKASEEYSKTQRLLLEACIRFLIQFIQCNEENASILGHPKIISLILYLKQYSLAAVDLFSSIISQSHSARSVVTLTNFQQLFSTVVPIMDSMNDVALLYPKEFHRGLAQKTIHCLTVLEEVARHEMDEEKILEILNAINIIGSKRKKLDVNKTGGNSSNTKTATQNTIHQMGLLESIAQYSLGAFNLMSDRQPMKLKGRDHFNHLRVKHICRLYQESTGRDTKLLKPIEILLAPPIPDIPAIGSTVKILGNILGKDKHAVNAFDKDAQYLSLEERDAVNYLKFQEQLITRIANWGLLSELPDDYLNCSLYCIKVITLVCEKTNKDVDLHNWLGIFQEDEESTNGHPDYRLLMDYLLIDKHEIRRVFLNLFSVMLFDDGRLQDRMLRAIFDDSGRAEPSLHLHSFALFSLFVQDAGVYLVLLDAHRPREEPDGREADKKKVIMRLTDHITTVIGHDNESQLRKRFKNNYDLLGDYIMNSMIPFLIKFCRFDCLRKVKAIMKGPHLSVNVTEKNQKPSVYHSLQNDLKLLFQRIDLISRHEELLQGFKAGLLDALMEYDAAMKRFDNTNATPITSERSVEESHTEKSKYEEKPVIESNVDVVAIYRILSKSVVANKTSAHNNPPKTSPRRGTTLINHISQLLPPLQESCISPADLVSFDSLEDRSRGRRNSIEYLKHSIANNLAFKRYESMWTAKSGTLFKVLFGHILAVVTGTSNFTNDNISDRPTAINISEELAHSYWIEVVTGALAEVRSNERKLQLELDDSSVVTIVNLRNTNESSTTPLADPTTAPSPQIRFREFQNILCDLGACKLVVGIMSGIFVSFSNGNQSLSILQRSAIKLGVALLEDGNMKTQNAVINDIRAGGDNGTSDSFLSSIRSLINLYQTKISETFGKGNNHHQTNEVTLFADIEILMNFLQQLCEGHNDLSQNFLSDQGPSEPTNINIVLEVAQFAQELIHIIVTKVDTFYINTTSDQLLSGQYPELQVNYIKRDMIAWSRVMISEAVRLLPLCEALAKVFATLIEMIQGPCVPNQLVVARAGTMKELSKLFRFFGALQLELEMSPQIIQQFVERKPWTIFEQKYNRSSDVEDLNPAKLLRIFERRYVQYVEAYIHGDAAIAIKGCATFDGIHLNKTAVTAAHDASLPSRIMVPAITRKLYYYGRDPLITKIFTHIDLCSTPRRRQDVNLNHHFCQDPETNYFYFEREAVKKRARAASDSKTPGGAATAKTEAMKKKYIYNDVSQICDTFMSLEKSCLEFLNSLLDGVAVEEDSEVAEMMISEVEKDNFIANTVNYWNRFLRLKVELDQPKQPIHGKSAKKANPMEFTMAFQYYALVMRFSDISNYRVVSNEAVLSDDGASLDALKKAINQWVQGERIPIDNHIARIELIGAVDRSIQIIYFPIPDIVKTYWSRQEIREMRTNILFPKLAGNRDSIEEKVKNFMSQGMELIDSLIQLKELENMASRVPPPANLLLFIMQQYIWWSNLTLGLTIAINIFPLLTTPLVRPAMMKNGDYDSAYYTAYGIRPPIALDYTNYDDSNDRFAFEILGVALVISACFATISYNFINAELFIKRGLMSNETNTIRLPQIYLLSWLFRASFKRIVNGLHWFKLTTLQGRDFIKMKNKVHFLHCSPGFIRFYHYIKHRSIYLWLVTVVAAFLGLLHSPLWFAALLAIEVFRKFSVMQAVATSFTDNFRQLIATIILAIIIIYLFVVVSFTSTDLFGKYSINNHKGCDSLLTCLLLHIDYGITQQFSFDEDYGHISTTGGEIYNFLFMFIVTIVIPGIVSGVIIDAFAERREMDKAMKNDVYNKCFICNIEREKFEGVGIDFENHIKTDHNMWKYLWYVIYIRERDINDMNGIEAFCYEQLVTTRGLSTRWLPLQLAKCLNPTSSDSIDVSTVLHQLQAVSSSLEEANQKFQSSLSKQNYWEKRIARVASNLKTKAVKKKK